MQRDHATPIRTAKVNHAASWGKIPMALRERGVDQGVDQPADSTATTPENLSQPPAYPVVPARCQLERARFAIKGSWQATTGESGCGWCCPRSQGRPQMRCASLGPPGNFLAVRRPSVSNGSSPAPSPAIRATLPCP